MEQYLMIKAEDLKSVVMDVVNELKKQEKPIGKKEDHLYTANEACNLLRCSKPTLHRWKRDGLIPFVRIGVNIRYKESDLNKLIEKKGAKR